MTLPRYRNLLLILMLMGAAAAACSTGARHSSSDPPAQAAASVGLSTTVSGANGTWVTVPMGDLSQPDNTFWQLFYRATGGSTWADDVEATATATNGGLVEASNGSTVAVGVRPSGRLTFSPVIATMDGGRAWSSGLLPSGLVERSDALALGPGGRAVAIVSGKQGIQLVQSTGGLTGWQALPPPPNPAGCRDGTIAAVAYDGSEPAVAVDCNSANVSAVYVRVGGGWSDISPNVSGPAGSGPAEVAALQSAPGGLSAVLAAGVSGRVSLGAAWWGPAATPHWTVSAGPLLPSGGRIASVGSAGAAGLFVLASTPGGAGQLAAVTSNGGKWTSLPNPPADTGAIAFGPAGAITALAPSGSMMTIWNLNPGSLRWARGQVIDVPIAYGSSS